jgi:hypothetical protein
MVPAGVEAQSPVVNREAYAQLPALHQAPPQLLVFAPDPWGHLLSSLSCWISGAGGVLSYFLLLWHTVGV